MTYIKWEDRSRWHKFKFRFLWEYRTKLDHIHAFLTRDNGIMQPQFMWNMYLWSMKELQEAILSYAIEIKDTRKESFITRVMVTYMKDLRARKPKREYHYYEYRAAMHMIENAYIYRFYCYNNSDGRAEDAHTWLGIMYSHAKDMSIEATKNG